MDTLETLKAARKLITPRERWTKKHYLKSELSKLSTRIDEIQLAETKAVEELARVREENQELRLVVKGFRMSTGGEHDWCGDAGIDPPCRLCAKADALLAPKPLDTNEGGE